MQSSWVVCSWLLKAAMISPALEHSVGVFQL